MGDFSDVGDFLKRKYTKAKLVEMNQDATGLIIYGKERQLRVSDMVYIEESPDYCTYDYQSGDE